MTSLPSFVELLNSLGLSDSPPAERERDRDRAHLVPHLSRQYSRRHHVHHQHQHHPHHHSRHSSSSGASSIASSDVSPSITHRHATALPPRTERGLVGALAPEVRLSGRQHRRFSPYSHSASSSIFARRGSLPTLTIPTLIDAPTQFLQVPRTATCSSFTFERRSESLPSPFDPPPSPLASLSENYYSARRTTSPLSQRDELSVPSLSSPSPSLPLSPLSPSRPSKQQSSSSSPPSPPSNKPPPPPPLLSSSPSSILLSEKRQEQLSQQPQNQQQQQQRRQHQRRLVPRKRLSISIEKAQTGCNDVAGWGRTPPICNLLRKSPTTPGSVTVHSDSTATPNTAATTASGYGNSNGPLTPSSASSPGNTTTAHVHSGGLKNAGGMSIPTVPPVLSPYSPTFHLYSSNYAHARERGDHHASPRSPFPLSAGAGTGTGTGTGTGNSPHHLTIPPAVVVVPRSGRGATVSISKKLRGGGIGFSSSDRHMGREIIPDGPISTPLVNVSNGTGGWRTLR